MVRKDESGHKAIVPEINFDQKQRINLSAGALEAIMEDAESFGDENNRTGFLNELLRRCTEASPATVGAAASRYCRTIEESLRTSLSKKEMQLPVIEKAVQSLGKEYETQLSKRAVSWPKGESFLFRLSNDNCRAFYGIPDGEGGYLEEPLYPLSACYRGKVSRYLKAILEDYASHTQYDREELYFHEEIDTIRLASETEKMIRVISSSPIHVMRTYDVRIYGLLPDDSGMHHYIVGMVGAKGGKRADEKIASLRLSRIREIRIPDGRYVRSGHLSVPEKKEIESRLAGSRVQFLLGDQEDIVVRLSPEGKSAFHYVQYMRPKVDFIDADGNYHFTCSRMQAENYFSRLGAGAEILEPEELRERLAGFYQKASEVYTK